MADEEVAAATEVDTADLAALAARAAEDKGGERPVILQVGGLLGLTDLFVITSASNTRLVRALIDHIEAEVASASGARPRTVEGRDDMRWVLMDYGDWVVHVFLEEARSFYDLERLWADVPRIEWATG